MQLPSKVPVLLGVPSNQYTYAVLATGTDGKVQHIGLDSFYDT